MPNEIVTKMIVILASFAFTPHPCPTNWTKVRPLECLSPTVPTFFHFPVQVRGVWSVVNCSETVLTAVIALSSRITFGSNVFLFAFLFFNFFCYLSIKSNLRQNKLFGDVCVVHHTHTHSGVQLNILEIKLCLDGSQTNRPGEYNSFQLPFRSIMSSGVV